MLPRICFPLVLVAILCHLCGLCGLCGGEAQGPTSNEALALAMINLHRADTWQGNFAVKQSVRAGAVPGVTSASARRALSSPRSVKPGLIWNPQLAATAKALLSTPIPPEKPLEATAAAATAGYAGEVFGAIGMAPGDLESNYAALFVRRVGTTTGKDPKPVFAGPGLLAARWREIGIAVRLGKPAPVLVVVLGVGPPGRMAGGTAWQDVNRNGQPDAGELLQGLTVTIAGASMTTGPGGVWWLPLSGNEATEVTLATAESKTKRAIPTGKGDSLIDWRAPIAADIVAADRAIAKAELVVKAKGVDEAQAELAAVALGARLWSLDDDRSARIATMTEPVAGRLQTAIDRCLEALTEDRTEFKAKVTAAQKPFGTALRDWARELDRLYDLREQLGKIQSAAKELRPQQADVLIGQIDKALKQSGDPAFVSQLRLWRDMAETF